MNVMLLELEGTGFVRQYISTVAFHLCNILFFYFLLNSVIENESISHFIKVKNC
jgi:hypothetical protein